VPTRLPKPHSWRRAQYVDPLRILDGHTGPPVIESVRGTADDASLGLRFTAASVLELVGVGTRLDLCVTTDWPRGLGLLGRLVERAMLSRGEATEELAGLTALVESRI
jgi:hypothetical protein